MSVFQKLSLVVLLSAGVSTSAVPNTNTLLQETWQNVQNQVQVDHEEVVKKYQSMLDNPWEYTSQERKELLEYLQEKDQDKHTALQATIDYKRWRWWTIGGVAAGSVATVCAIPALYITGACAYIGWQAVFGIITKDNSSRKNN